MTTQTFNRLKKSIREAGDILRGETVDLRSFTYDKPKGRKPVSVLAIFIGSDDDLVAGKIYNVQLLSPGKILVNDEAGESLICDEDDFLPVRFQPRAEKILRELAAA